MKGTFQASAALEGRHDLTYQDRKLAATGRLDQVFTRLLVRARRGLRLDVFICTMWALQSVWMWTVAPPEPWGASHLTWLVDVARFGSTLAFAVAVYMVISRLTELRRLGRIVDDLHG